jgi:hypothetical protein
MNSKPFIFIAQSLNPLDMGSGIILPAIILLIAMVCSGSILVATRYRQSRFNAFLNSEMNQKDKDLEIIGTIFWMLDSPVTQENYKGVFQDLHHYAWMITHQDHIDFCVKIRDYDEDRLENFDGTQSFLTSIRQEAKALLGH